MDYYTLSHAVATKDTGPINPQIKGFFEKDVTKMEKSLYRLYDNDSVFPSEVFIPKLELCKEANFTDVLSSSMLILHGFLLSKRLKELLIKYSLPDFQCYNVSIVDKNLKEETYYWLHMLYKFRNKSFIDYQKEYTDFKNSSFAITKNLRIIKSVKINSFDDLQKKKEELGFMETIRGESLFVRKIFFQIGWDIFKIPLLGSKWIISENLKKAIVAGGFSGLDIKRIDLFSSE